jgi:hypothetical protein
MAAQETTLFTPKTPYPLLTKKKLSADQVAQLREPLPKDAVKPHPTKDYLSTIKVIYVVERLNDVFGVEGWEVFDEVVEKSGKMVVVHSTLTVPEYGIRKSAFGGNDNPDLGDAYKGACTDALSKIGSMLYIGMDVYKGLADKPATRRAQPQKASQPPENPDAEVPAVNLSLAITKESEDAVHHYWLCKNGVECIVFVRKDQPETGYKRLLEQVGRRASIKAWKAGEKKGYPAYELAQVVSVASPMSPQQPETTKPEFNTEAGTFKGKVVSVTPQKRLDKEFLTVMTNHRLKPIDKLNVSFTCFHKSLTSALTDCVDRECVLKLKENKGYWNVEDVLEIEGIPYKDGKVAD